MSALQNINNRIKRLDEIKWILNRWRFKSDQLVFTNGVFDILHKGHVDYLSKAKDLGSKLIVGINSDKSVRTLNKGTNRPLQDENSRALIIAALHFVDMVVIFDESTPFNLIKAVRPNILVKGSDYQLTDIVGHDILAEYGGEVKTIDYIEGHSTTAIIEKARKN